MESSRRGNQAITCPICMAGLDTIDGRVEPEQAVAVGLGDLVIAEFLDRIVLGVLFGEVADQRAGQSGKITGGGVVLRVGHAGGVAETGVFHAEALSLAIHHLGEILFTAGDGLCQCDAGVVARLNDHALDQVFYDYLRVDLDEHARTLGFPRFF